MRPERIHPIEDWLRARPHPADTHRRLRQLAGPLLLVIGLGGCALAMLAAMLTGAGLL